MTSDNSSFDSIKDAINDISNGKMIIVVDDEDRENEGDLLMAAHFVTEEAINFMIKHGKGLVCVPVTDTILNRLNIGQMVQKNTESHQTAFSISIDAHEKHGVSTGISAADRAKTIRVLIDPESSEDDLVTPGHIFPLRAREMGVLRRAGHTEAAVDLARLAGLSPAGVICEIINEDGSMARVPDLEVFAKEHQLKMITIKDLIKYRLEYESFVTEVEEVDMPTDYGHFKLHCFKDELNNKYHYALVMGEITEKMLLRVHSECVTGDVFGSQRCDCGPQLHTAMKLIAENGSGMVLYMSQEGRGIGIANKLKAYKLQEQGLDTVEANNALGFSADLRDYGVGAQMLRKLGVKRLDLITNNPRKIVGLEGYGIKVESQVPIKIEPGKYNQKYLSTKKEKLGHLF